MPEMSGIDVLKHERAAQNEVPFGFIISERPKETWDVAVSSGATFMICNPFSAEDVQEALAAVLGRC
jgi:CheY-like chemotaxis protein